jgi:hypothetical protein
LSRGTDCTEAFEAHHLDSDKVEKVLRLFYVRDADPEVAEMEDAVDVAVGPAAAIQSIEQVEHYQSNEEIADLVAMETHKENGEARLRALIIPPEGLGMKVSMPQDVTGGSTAVAPTATGNDESRIFTYRKGEFWQVLKGRVLAKLMNQPGVRTVMQSTGPSLSMKLACGVCVSQFAVAHYLAARFGSKVMSVLAGLGLIGCWGVGHNFMHQAEKTAGSWTYAIDLTPLSSHQQRGTHALSHHMYPNLHCDIECYSLDNLLPFLPAVNKEASHLTKQLYPALLVAMAPVLACVGKLKHFQQAVATKGVRRLVGGEWAYLLPLLQLLHFVKYNGVLKGLGLFTIQMGTFQGVFTPIGLAVHHSAKEKEPDEEEGGAVQEGREKQQEKQQEYETRAWHEGQPGAERDFGRHQVKEASEHICTCTRTRIYSYITHHTLIHSYTMCSDAHTLYHALMHSCTHTLMHS